MNATGAPKTFDIGIVMAGAVSGGAYTAGVLDFLFEALDAFESAKARGEPDCPRHRVRIKVMTGTSAGAMCVALGLRALLRRDETPSSLYRAWVQLISAKALLTTSDLTPDKSGSPCKVTSFLNSTALDDVACATLEALPACTSLPPYVDEDLSLGVCTAQLRGIPYTVSMVGSGSYAMNLHSVEHWFEVREWQSKNVESGKWWTGLTQACIASGAFPFGLSPRLLSLPDAVYAKRTWPGTGLKGPCLVSLPPPSWPSGMKDTVATFHVDGGLFNNEPLELARVRLTPPDDPPVQNPDDGTNASWALLMIDPFLEVPPGGAMDEPVGILDLFPGILSAMLENARFKPAELLLANDESVFSRFVIAPRDARDGTTTKYALASGVLGAFGGFLSERFREHDYRLGRRNCQKFLKDSFALPIDNAVVADWADAMKKHQFTDKGEAFRRLVPLYDAAAEEVPRPAPPAWTPADGLELRQGLARRGDAVVYGLLDQYARSRWVRGALKAAWWVLRSAAHGRLMELLQEALQERGLDVPDGRDAGAVVRERSELSR